MTRHSFEELWTEPPVRPTQPSLQIEPTLPDLRQGRFSKLREIITPFSCVVETPRIMDPLYDLPVVLDCLSSSDPTPEQLDAAWQAVERSSQELDETLDDWLTACSGLRPTSTDPQAAKTLLLERLIEVLHKRVLARELSDDGWFESIQLESLVSWYHHLGSLNRARAYLLAILAREGSASAMDLLAECLVEDPPTEVLSIDLVFASIFQRRSRHVQQMFPRLLDGIGNPDVAPGILDLANFLDREGYSESHVASDILPQLTELLGGIVANLSRIEAGSYDEQRSADAMQQQVLASISLGVSICDCLALTRYQPALERVVEALELGHRRMRCEAAWALARLEDPRGPRELIQLAEEPVARLRVLAYAEELGIADQISEELQSAAARAEAELVVWLAQPTQMGLAPTEIELLEHRVLSWPGYEEPRDCYLFRFGYDLGRGNYSNVGIVGPVTQAVTADLLDLPPQDIFAFFAGTNAHHEDIQEQPVEELVSGYDAEIARLERRLKDEGLDEIQPRIFGIFFGDRILVAEAMKIGEPGVAVTDKIDVYWFPKASKDRPLGAAEVYALYKGRKLLQAFNPSSEPIADDPGDEDTEA